MRLFSDVYKLRRQKEKIGKKLEQNHSAMAEFEKAHELKSSRGLFSHDIIVFEAYWIDEAEIKIANYKKIGNKEASEQYRKLTNEFLALNQRLIELDCQHLTKPLYCNTQPIVYTLLFAALLSFARLDTYLILTFCAIWYWYIAGENEKTFFSLLNQVKEHNDGVSDCQETKAEFFKKCQDWNARLDKEDDD